MISHKPSEPKRTAAGSLLVFVIAGIFLIVVVAFIFLVTLVVMGGSTQLQNAVDAGALSVARRSLTEIGVKPANDAELVEEIVNAHGEINAENYNRMVAKVYLISINQTAMGAMGQSTSDSQQSAFEAFESARDNSVQLGEALKDDAKLEDFFHNCADANSLRLLGAPKIAMERPVPTAYLDRGTKTCIYFEPNDTPEGFNSASMKPVSKGGKKWIPGYVPLETNGQGFCFTPQPSRPPHLVSLYEFNENRHKPQLNDQLPASNCLPVLPNGFELKAQVTNHNQTLKTVACAEADSITTGYPMELPRAFVRIRNAKPVFRSFFHENIPLRRKDGTSYGSWSLREDPPKACFKDYTDTLKKEWEAKPNAWDEFVGEELMNQTKVLRSQYEQRGKEILSGTKLEQHDPPFSECKLPEGNIAYLFRNASDNKLMFRVEGDGDLGSAPWVTNRTDRAPDGQIGLRDQMRVTRSEYKLRIPVPRECAIAVKIDQDYRWFWQPGTGKNGVLGELSMRRVVTFRFLGDGAAPDPALYKDTVKH